MKPNKYAKLRRLLGQQTTATYSLEFWQRAEFAPTEQWRGQAAIQAELTKARTKLASVEHEIANEMRARLGIPSGQLIIRRDERLPVAA